MNIQITLRQAIRLLCYFGDNDAQIEVSFHEEGDFPDAAVRPSPAGLYAHNLDCPDQAAEYLGPTCIDEDFKTAACNVLIERQRQIDQENWTPAHDIEHPGGTLAIAAASYALHAAAELTDRQDVRDYFARQSIRLWPWEIHSYKPRDPYRDLVRAAALMLAEAERMRRNMAPEHIESNQQQMLA